MLTSFKLSFLGPGSRGARGATIVVLGLMAGCGSPEDPAVASLAVEGSVSPAWVNADLATLRRTVARYHDLGAAIADGFTASSRPCTDPVAGETQFFVSPALGEPGVQVDAPEILDYEPSPDARDGYRLVAVTYLEYLTFRGDPTTPRPPPVLFGQTFSGPYGSVRGNGPFWALRVWLQGNPDGTFAFTNPNVSCELPGESGGG